MMTLEKGILLKVIDNSRLAIDVPVGTLAETMTWDEHWVFVKWVQRERFGNHSLFDGGYDRAIFAIASQDDPPPPVSIDNVEDFFTHVVPLLNGGPWQRVEAKDKTIILQDGAGRQLFYSWNSFLGPSIRTHYPKASNGTDLNSVCAGGHVSLRRFSHPASLASQINDYIIASLPQQWEEMLRYLAKAESAFAEIKEQANKIMAALAGKEATVAYGSNNAVVRLYKEGMDYTITVRDTGVKIESKFQLSGNALRVIRAIAQEMDREEVKA